MTKDEAFELFKTRPMMKCGCVAMAIYNKGEEYGVACIVHDCTEIAEKPDLTGRKARCSYYGKPVKRGNYNSNACPKCKVGDVCRCEEPSSFDLWFFKYKPNEDYDEFYCACKGAD